MRIGPASLVFGLAALSTSASAQPSEPSAPVQRYQLTLPSLSEGQIPVVLRPETPGMMLSLSRERRGSQFAMCRETCAIALEPGEYWITAGATDSTREGRRRITLSEPTRLDVTGRDGDSVDVGLALGIIGPVLTVGGMVAMLAGAFRYEEVCSDSSSSSCTRSDDGTTLLVGGLSALVAGLVLTPIGWVMFGKRAPTVNATPLRLVR